MLLYLLLLRLRNLHALHGLFLQTEGTRVLPATAQLQ